jgi:hypothetical protein
MSYPRLTFYCEVGSGALPGLIRDSTLADLSALGARLSLGILDFDPARIKTVHRLNKAGIPVVAWLLLPKEQGYYFHLRNAYQALSFYEDFRAWTEKNGLLWAGVGLDIEPDICDFSEIASRRWRSLPQIFKRSMERKRLREAKSLYRSLVNQIHSDGYTIESYQFPIIDDERTAGSTLLQRISGLVDIPVDREVWMLYSSFVRPDGAGFLASYAPQAQAIALGVTGGGVDAGIEPPPPLTWEEFSRDLRLAWNWCEDLFIFSLEGCIQQGFLERLKTFEWDRPIILPETSINRVNNVRWTLRIALWVSAHFAAILVCILGVFLVVKGIGRFLKKHFRFPRL